MTTIEKIKGRCHVDDDTGCWHWRGASSKGHPRIYAADPMTGKKTVQTGGRAVWQASTGQAIPKGWRVYRKGCAANDCVCPAHLACGPTADWGRQVAQTGHWKGQSARINANRAIGRKRAKVTPKMMALIQASDKTGSSLSAELGVGRSSISRARRGELRSVAGIANPFAGLMRPTA